LYYTLFWLIGAAGRLQPSLASAGEEQLHCHVLGAVAICVDWRCKLWGGFSARQMASFTTKTPFRMRLAPAITHPLLVQVVEFFFIIIVDLPSVQQGVPEITVLSL